MLIYYVQNWGRLTFSWTTSHCCRSEQNNAKVFIAFLQFCIVDVKRLQLFLGV